ncbi:MAG: TRAP transporter small permease [Deferribacterota bacterium]|nr:TRAP transporter small permease [Deferribacterota bacterium]
MKKINKYTRYLSSKLLSINYLIESTLISLGVIGLVIILIADVIAREFFRSIYYSDEITRFLIILVTFSGLSYAARNARHIRMGAISELLPTFIEKPIILLSTMISSFTMFMLCYYSISYLIHLKSVEQLTPILRIPYWYFIIVAPIGFFMTGLQYLLAFIKNLTHKETWASAIKKNEYD